MENQIGTCRIEGCPTAKRSRGLCSRHWQAEKKAGRLDQYSAIPRVLNTCGHVDRKHGGNGLCHSCYMSRWMKANPNANSGNGWAKQNPEKHRRLVRRAILKKQHGITPETFESMWRDQDGKCANTRCSFESPLNVRDHRKGGLQVDHDHATGEVRGLLCRNCNVTLGHARDDLNRLAGLAEYLTALN